MDKTLVYKLVARRLNGGQKTDGKPKRLTKADVKRVMETYADVMKIMLNKHPEETFLLPNIGKFSIVEVPEKKGVAGFNGIEYCTPAHSELRFTFMDKVKYLEK